MIGIAAAAMALGTAAALVPATGAQAAAPFKLAGYSNGQDLCLNSNISAVPCSATSARWLFTVADAGKQTYRVLSTTGNWDTCIEQQPGTDHLRRVTCTWSPYQLWHVESVFTSASQIRREGTNTCLEMNRTNAIPNGVVTATGCNQTAPQGWRMT